MPESEWFESVSQRIDRLAAALPAKQQQQLQLPLLRRAVARLDGYQSAGCETCGELRGVVDQLVTALEQVGAGVNLDRRQHQLRLTQVLSHLKAQHQLVEEGAYLSQFIALGLCFGAALLSVLGPAYIGVGLCLGVAIGSAWDAKAKQAGRVL